MLTKISSEFLYQERLKRGFNEQRDCLKREKNKVLKIKSQSLLYMLGKDSTLTLGHSKNESSSNGLKHNDSIHITRTSVDSMLEEHAYKRANSV